MKNNKQMEDCVKQSSTPQTDLLQQSIDRLFGELGDLSYGDLSYVKKALVKGDIQTAWDEFENEKNHALGYYAEIEDLLSKYETSI